MEKEIKRYLELVKHVSGVQFEIAALQEVATDTFRQVFFYSLAFLLFCLSGGDTQNFFASKLSTHMTLAKKKTFLS